MIGILCAHGETVIPQNPEYSAFFDMIREHGRRTEAIDRKIDDGSIADFTSLLLGEPHRELDTEELESLRSWMAAGGSLLTLSALGGDDAPAGDSSSQTNMGSILDLDFGDDAVGVDHGILQGRPFDTKIEVDVSSLITQPATLCYDTGCTLSWENDPSAITHALRVPKHASIMSGVRLRHQGRSIGSFDPNPQPGYDNEYLFLRIRTGQGRMTALGSSWVFRNETLVRFDNVLFLNWLLPLWLPNLVEEEFESRRSRPQRHRLLHGYPMAPLMTAFTEKTTELERLEEDLVTDSRRPIAIGILPHPFCNPAVKGCGFCTFPHEVFSSPKGTAVDLGVVREMDAVLGKQPDLQKREVKAVYFGGGTANLTPAEAFRTLCRKLSASFELTQAEITLEGVPAYFTVRKPLLLEILREEIPAWRYRLSMGIQTFDEAQLRRMGRTAFGTSATFQQVVDLGHSLGYRVSGDLLFNLPGQTQADMQEDVARAMALGVEQICLYHLVMFDGLGTEWSRDPALLAKLPSNSDACANWLVLREFLLGNGYRQTTLTNFERAEVHDTENRFLYEESVFSPEQNDWLGFGPSAISLFVDRGLDRAVKLLNPESSVDYLRSLESASNAWSRYFSYSPRDMKVLYLTRKLARLAIRRGEYYQHFHADPLSDFPLEFATLIEKGLLAISKGTINVTPLGMFFADTAAGLLAWRQVKYKRCQQIIAGFAPQPEDVLYGRRSDDATNDRMG